jgi:four helix bundle protein
MNDYRRLDVWHLALDIAEAVYVLTSRFPRSERYGITQQTRRAAVSVSSNIAEGASRGSNPDFRRFLSIAMGSAAELDSQIELSERVGYVRATVSLPLRRDIDKCQAMLAGLAKSVD